ncbi:geranylgeranylglyceryl/heptaprenylglyceryl phosphate synthase [Fluviicola sp.]|jgi:putative glycerol-1-phosphate prenyltransferase|uniref:geranylgeranylglyceryl/heptaprenylglyceryl phosphate synthase n=1 Tax=Fluviicola sp. TaxID=1917219 RepID=UPI00282E9352|nr:geranylgeranylglyceryl/heptaprenylglyceryl phosphate synthase [Fluviicola sp.]MDR0802858.1 geranylgeranylglyceryl/heptaprenylglyceryl phosphate synthase [Fluviicola sp.]
MNILSEIQSKTGQLALLIDPEKTKNEKHLSELIKKAEFAAIDFFFIGGSTVTRKETEAVVSFVKAHSVIPVVLFPGSGNQLSGHADALLFLNLLSGRNPDFLIGHHISCAEEVLEMNIEVIPTSYLLIDGGKMTSAAYVSQTTPIPRENNSISLKTGIAGYLMGQKLTYFDAGSGALYSVPTQLIEELKKKIETPVIVGGGIRSVEQIEAFKNAGANVIVIGNKIEENIDFLLDIEAYQKAHSETINHNKTV